MEPTQQPEEYRILSWREENGEFGLAVRSDATPEEIEELKRKALERATALGWDD